MPPRARRPRTKPPTLTVVAPDTEPEAAAEPSKPTTILDASEAGDRLGELRAMRRRIAKALDDPATAAKDISPLTRNLMVIGKEIEAIEIADDEEASVVANVDDEAWDGTGY